MGCSSSSTAQTPPPVPSSQAPAVWQAKTAGDAGKMKPTKLSPDQEKQESRRKNAEYIGTLTALNKVPLLKRLPKDQHPMLAACCVAQVFAAGDTIIKQGDMGEEFFLIRTGAAAVLVGESGGKPKEVATLREGDYFGENALLHDEPRNATIRAKGEVTCLVIARKKFEELGLHQRLEFSKRKVVKGTVRDPDAETELLKDRPEVKEKSAKERAFIGESLKKNQNLNTLASLDDNMIKQLCDAAWREEIAPGQQVIQQGDDKADFFYVVESGSFDILVSHLEPSDGTESGDVHPEKVGVVAAGGSFGELALMYNAPRAATVQATVNSSVWVMDRLHFKRMLMKASNDKVDQYAMLLENVEIFSSMLADEKRQVAEALEEMTFTKRENIITQGDVGHTFYILCEGEVAVIKDGKQVNTLSARTETQVAQYFGERSLLNNEPRAATIEVTSPTAKVLALDKSLFDLLSTVHQLMSDSANGKKRKKRPSLPPAQNRSEEALTMEDLSLIGVLGVGAFGKVELREHKSTKKTYAIKAMSKGYIVKMRMQYNVINEKHILASVDSPFIIKLYCTSQSAQWIYFYLEPAMGGELYVIYHRKGFHGSSTHAKYYAASVVMAFEHLHDRHVIYRDLKPENLLLTAEGYLKLTDMGLAKFALGKTYTTCGTPEYFAPEVIRSAGQTRAVDWWTLGILIFEFMTGSAPFRAETDMAMYGKVLKGINHVQFPSKCGTATEDIVKAVLKSDPSERLPMRQGGVKNLKNHHWFKGFDWSGLVSRALPPPYVPAVKSHTDLRNFGHVKDGKIAHTEYRDDGSGWDADF